MGGEKVVKTNRRRSGRNTSTLPGQVAAGTREEESSKKRHDRGRVEGGQRIRGRYDRRTGIYTEDMRATSLLANTSVVE